LDRLNWLKSTKCNH